MDSRLLLKSINATEIENQDPLVSICIPTYNHAAMIVDAIESAVNQSYARLEILIFDNCSADDTEARVSAMASRDQRIRYLRHDTNVGMANNFNACVFAARGEFILVLSADDILENNCISRLLRSLQAQPAAVLASCARTLVDETLVAKGVIRRLSRRQFLTGEELRRECVAFGNRIGEPSAVLFRASTASRGFSSDFSQLLDLEMWFYLFGKGGGVFVSDPLCRIRQHANQVTKANHLSGRLIDEKRHFFRTVIAPTALKLRIVEKILWDLRMAVSVSRFNGAGGKADATLISEVYFQSLFITFIPPLRLLYMVRPLLRNALQRVLTNKTGGQNR